MNIRLSLGTDNALTTLLRTGPYKAPNRFSIAKVKASLPSVLQDLRDENEDDNAADETPDSEFLAHRPYPFTYDGTLLTEDGTLPEHGFSYTMFKDRSSVGVEVTTGSGTRTRDTRCPCEAFTTSAPRQHLHQAPQ